MPMIVGVVSDPEAQKLLRLYETAPIKLIHQPILILSAPTESIKDNTTLGGDDDWVEVAPLTFAYPYNPKLDNTECHVVCNSKKLQEIRRQFIKNPAPNFVPSFILAYDPMRSRTSKAFLQDFVYSMQHIRLKFELMVVNDPKHFVERSYNGDAQPILQEEYSLVSDTAKMFDI